MKKLILGCAFALVADVAQADAYVSNYMTSECGFRGFMASTLNANKEVGVDAMQEALYQWVKAVATSPSTKDNVMYPAFKAWYDNTNEAKMRAWIEQVVKYDNPVEASQTERLACEKEKAGEQ